MILAATTLFVPQTNFPHNKFNGYNGHSSGESSDVPIHKIAPYCHFKETDRGSLFQSNNKPATNPDTSIDSDSLFQCNNKPATNPVIEYITNECNKIVNYSDKKRFLNTVWLALKYYQSVLNGSQESFDWRMYRNADYDVDIYILLTNPDDKNSFWNKFSSNDDVEVVLRQVGQLYMKNKITRLGDRGYEYKGDFIIYNSKHGDPSIDYNCKFKFPSGVLRSCRQIGFERLRLGKDYSTAFSRDIISAIPTNHFDDQSIEYKGDHYALFELDNFGEELYKLCENMQFGEKKYIIITSENHLMTLDIYCGLSDVIVMFYHAKHTISHKRAPSYFGLSSLKNIRIEDFLSEDEMKKYFQTFKFGMFIVYDNPNEDFSVKAKYDFAKINYLEHAGQSLVSLKAIYAFMCRYGASQEVVNNLFDAVDKYNMSSEQWFDFVSAKDERGVPAIYIAFQCGYSDVIKAVTHAVLNNLMFTSDQKFRLLSGKTVIGDAGLAKAIANSQLETIMAFIVVLANNKSLESHYKLELLLARNHRGKSALYVIMQHKQLPSELIRILLDYEIKFSDKSISDILLINEFNKNRVSQLLSIGVFDDEQRSQVLSMKEFSDIQISDLSLINNSVSVRQVGTMISATTVIQKKTSKSTCTIF